jgi:hypothetical protein
MAAADLTKAWQAAASAAPKDWQVMGVARGPRIADPAIEDDGWVAWARGPADDPPVEGRGGSPEAALDDLAERLKHSAQF